MTEHIAYLTGTRRSPQLELKFGWGARTDRGVDVMKWVKSLPDRTWDPSGKQWIITGVGNRPDQLFDAAGITVDFSRCEGDLAGVTSLAEVGFVLWQRSPIFPGEILIRPRLIGANALWDRLGGGLVYEKKRDRFSIMLMDLIDLAGNPKKRFELDADGHAAALAQRARVEIPDNVRVAARALAVHSGVDPDQLEQKHLSVEAQGLIDIVATHTGYIPEWFGLDLFPFQRCGVYAAAAGHGYLADEPGLGKGSPKSTRILTPTGWTTYGEVSVGDRVIGSNGKSTRVLGVYPRGELDVFNVTMNDGASVVVDGDHLWQVQDRQERSRGSHVRVRSTRDLMSDDLRHEEVTGNSRHLNFIPMVGSVEFDQSVLPLPIHPYLLGALLGDGHLGKTIQITSADQWIIDRLTALAPEGYRLTPWGDPVRTAAQGRTHSYGFSRYDGTRPSPNPIKSAIEQLGLLGTHSDTKFVPQQYLFAAPSDRLEMLRGILDADGYAGTALEYTTVSPRLADDVQFLVESLGGQARRVVKSSSYVSRDNVRVAGKPVHRMIISMPAELNPFAIPRKADAWRAPFKYGPMRAISSIEPAGHEEVICISVEAEDQLYVTEHCIVTHNTRQGLGVMALRGFKRGVIVCPPLVLTNWARETAAALNPGMPADPPPVPLKSGKMPKKADFPAWLKVIYPTRKMPAFPDQGVIVVADSLLSSRPELLQELIAWGPTVMLADEVHRLKTWTTDRGVAVRRLATAVQAAGGLSVPLTGTPLLASSPELANQLQISGHLGPIFGGASQYMEKFAMRNLFGGWSSRKRAMPELHALLYGHSWVRRNKAEVLKQLPKKWRVTRYVDVPTTLFTKAHEALYEKIGLWVDEMNDAGRPLNDEAIKKYSADHIDLISPMRVAAGVSKVPAAIDYINDWMASTTRTVDGAKVYDRPLVVWTHHRDVMDALIAAVPEGKYAFGKITGETPATGRAAMADRYQAGEIGILFASIQAAGFGITLTRGSDSLFVETDWTNASISQAEDRQWRIGQVNPVVATTLISKETLDVSIRAVQRRKGDLLNIVVPGGDNDVAQADARLSFDGGVYEEIPEEELEEGMPKNQFEIVERIVKEVVAKLAHQKVPTRKAA